MPDFITEYWIEWLFGLAIAGLSLCCKKFLTKIKEQEAIKDGVVAILHDRLFQSGMCYLNKGEISVSEMENLECLYVAYHKLGGNGTGTEIYERVQNLKIK